MAARKANLKARRAVVAASGTNARNGVVLTKTLGANATPELRESVQVFSASLEDVSKSSAVPKGAGGTAVAAVGTAVVQLSDPLLVVPPGLLRGLLRRQLY
jgi:hypothetical protein